MSGCPVNPYACGSDLVSAIGAVGGDIVGDAVSSAWQQVCQSFADAASSLLQEFAKAFAAISDPDLASGGITSVFGISLGIAAVVAALLLIGQVIRTGFTHDGSAVAAGLTGLAKAALACMLTLTVGTVALEAANGITSVILVQSFGSGHSVSYAEQELSKRLGELLGGSAFATGGTLPAALLLIFGILVILLVIVLWFELLLRNAAIAVLIATSPIAATGQMSEATRSWWLKLVSATVQLIILKPVIALVFAVGLNLAGEPGTVENLLEGMLVLVLAVFAWPAVARFFAFASVQVAGTAGLGMLLGFAAGRASGDGGGSPAGVEPSEFSRRAEQHTMSQAGEAGSSGGAMLPGGVGGGLGALGSAGGTITGSTASGAGGAAGSAGAAAAGPAGAVIAAARGAQKALNSLTGHMEQMAGHAGMPNANPYAQPAGTPRNPGASRYRYPAPPASQEPPDSAPASQAPQLTSELSGDVTEFASPPEPPLPWAESELGEEP